MSIIIKIVCRIFGINGEASTANHSAESQSSNAPTPSIDTRSYTPSTPTIYQQYQSTKDSKSARPLNDSPKKPESSSKNGQSILSKSTSSFSATNTHSKPSSSSTPKPPPISNPTLRLTPVSDGTNQHAYTLDSKSSLPLYLIPKDVEELIKNGIVPRVLKNPLSPSTYKENFAALLHAEDFYLEKWSKFKLENVSFELQKIKIYKKTDNVNNFQDPEMDHVTFVAFEIDSIPEKRPFLLSRDLVHARPYGRKIESFKGFVYRVGKSNDAFSKRNVVLVDFGQDFISWHKPSNKYDVSFTFNRVCLKRAHQAIEDASDSLFQNFLFPEPVTRKRIIPAPVLLSSNPRLDHDQKNAVCKISSLHSSPPYLIEGPLCIYNEEIRGSKSSSKLSRTGLVVREAVFEIFRTSVKSRILICAHTNRACDELMRDLKGLIPESDMFRAIAAFRELGDVPDDILTSCDYDEDKACFPCPPLNELSRYKIILSTFMSSFRLHNKGLALGHFSHIFLLDASSAIEPEALVPVTKFATNATTVIVTGQTGNRPYWVRSDIARRHGLKISYFERLEERLLYKRLDPLFITRLKRKITM